MGSFGGRTSSWGGVEFAGLSALSLISLSALLSKMIPSSWYFLTITREVEALRPISLAASLIVRPP